LEAIARNPQLRCCLNHCVPELQCSQFRPRQFDRREVADTYSDFVDLDNAVERFQIVGCQLQIRLGLKNVDSGVFDVDHNFSN